MTDHVGEAEAPWGNTLGVWEWLSRHGGDAWRHIAVSGVTVA